MTLPSFDPHRRRFIGQACCAAVGYTGLLSTLAQLRAIGASAGDSLSASTPDYRALVCLFLSGGNDGNNVLVPTSPGDYESYAASRGTLALPRTGLLPMAFSSYHDGRTYGLHPSMPELQGLFAQGKAAFLANVGTLVQPTTLDQYRAGVGLPPQLFSHSDQQVQWQSSLPDQPFRTGWGGRLADVVQALNSNSQVSMSISLYGSNSFQVGQTVSELAVNPAGVTTVYGYQSAGNYGVRYQAMKSILGEPQADLFSAAFAGATGSAIQDSEALSAALQAAPRLRTGFPGSSIGRQLEMVAKLISVAPALGLRRQIFFCQLYGWDLHAAQMTSHGPLLADISGSLGAFYNATTELGLAERVTTFTASDFGRTYNTNGDGSDHGWGSHHWVVGGAVRGGDLYGTMPSLKLGGPDDTGRGRWLPSTSVDEYSATLASWFGVSASNLPIVLPNIGRFSRPNLGFLG